MNEPLVVLGAALVAGAIVGGSLKIANVELPSIIDSIPRQLLLGCFGAIVMGIGLIGVVDGGSQSDVPDGPVTPGNVAPARIELSKDKGPPGTKLTVSGVDFAPNELIEVYGHIRELRDDIRTDTKGRFSGERVTIPQDRDPFFNPYRITAVGRSSGESVSEEFEVTGKP